MNDAMFLIAKLGLFVLSVSFFMANRPGAGGYFLGLAIVGTGVESKGVGRVVIIAFRRAAYRYYALCSKRGIRLNLANER